MSSLAIDENANDLASATPKKDENPPSLSQNLARLVAWLDRQSEKTLSITFRRNRPDLPADAIAWPIP